MIHLADAMPNHPELGLVEVDCSTCHGTVPLSDFGVGGEPQQQGKVGHFRQRYSDMGTACPCGAGLPDLSAILTINDLAEVGEMAMSAWFCASCRATLSNDPCCFCTKAATPVTARLLLWTGEPVDFEELFASPDQNGELSNPRMLPDGSPILTAVILLLDPEITQRLDEETLRSRLMGVRAASTSCAEAGVQFIVPGDPERGRLEL